MRTEFVTPDEADEYATVERCAILVVWHDDRVSVARARVKPGVTTQLHRLQGVDERYLVLQGTGIAKIGDAPPRAVAPGDAVIIPAGTAQQITATGSADLLFYCICTPPFTPECYQSAE